MKPFAKNGIQNGFEILVDVETFDYTMSPTTGEGIIISILHNLDIPIMKNTGIRFEKITNLLCFQMKIKKSTKYFPLSASLNYILCNFD